MNNPVSQKDCSYSMKMYISVKGKTDDLLIVHEMINILHEDKPQNVGVWNIFMQSWQKIPWED